VGRMLKGDSGDSSSPLPPGEGGAPAQWVKEGFPPGDSCGEGFPSGDGQGKGHGTGGNAPCEETGTPVVEPEDKQRVVTAKRPNHVWHVDLTTVPTAAGFCATWLPFALPQCWPFCWWVAVAIDYFSRRVMGIAVFAKQPTSAAARAFLG